jgi:hypothetical protein
MFKERQFWEEILIDGNFLFCTASCGCMLGGSSTITSNAKILAREQERSHGEDNENL